MYLMKKMMMLALALVMMLTLTGAALAESAPMSKEDQMKNMAFWTRTDMNTNTTTTRFR